MITFDTFEKLITTVVQADEKRDGFENSLENLLGEGSNVMSLWITDPLWNMLETIIVDDLKGSSDDFCFLQENLYDIVKGEVNSVWVHNKEKDYWGQYDIKSVKDFYDYLNKSLPVSKVIGGDEVPR
jgi:hypothetical protein